MAAPPRDRPRNPFADDVTARVTPDGVPVTLDDLPTSPVAEVELERLRRETADPAPADRPAAPYVEIPIAGRGRMIALPAPNFSPTGLAVEVPQGIDLELDDNQVLVVRLHLGQDETGAPVEAQVPARVAHRRPPSPGKPGGMALRWEVADPDARRDLESLLARARPGRGGRSG